MRVSLNQAQMAQHNRAAVLSLIRRTGGTSRTELAQRLQLVRSAVTGIANPLLDTGIIRQEPLNTTKRSDPKSHLVLNPDWGHVISISLMYDLAVGVVNLAGEVVHSEHIRGDGGLTSRQYKDDFYRLIPDVVGRLVSQWSHRNLLGIGVLSSGYVDTQGLIRFNVELPERNVDMAKILAPVTDLPVHTDQELRLLLMWRAWQQEPGRWRNVAAFNPGLLGDRGRHALYINGSLYYGHDGMMGLPGRMTGVPHGMDVTDPLLEKVRVWGGEQAYLDRVKAGDGEAAEIYRIAVKNYGYRLAHLANAFSPDAAILFSPYVALGDAFLKEIMDEARTYVDQAHGCPEPTILDAIELQFGGNRCEAEWLPAATVPVLSRIFDAGIIEPVTAKEEPEVAPVGA
jgi:predicted NBD/HSP70 family sugar kinase